MTFAVGFLNDWYNHLAGNIAAHDERIGFVELGCVNEFQKALLRPMQVGCKKNLSCHRSIILSS
jgi:hypothetical protein